MATLADAFLNDFGESDEEEELQQEALSEESEVPDLATDKQGLLANKDLQKMLLRAEQKDESRYDTVQLVEECNKWTRRLDEAVARSLTQLQEHYATRFSALAAVVPDDARTYCAALRVVYGHELDLLPLQKELSQVLTNQQVLALTIAATSLSKKLGGQAPEVDAEYKNKAFTLIQAIEQACEARDKISALVSDRMLHVVPNCVALVGEEVAAQLVALAGGVRALAKMPACNLRVLGQKTQAAALMRATGGAFHKLQGGHHEGVICNAPILNGIPPKDRAKALRVLGNKVTLAVRADASNLSSAVVVGAKRDEKVLDDSYGQKLRAGVEKKLAKWREPPKHMAVRAMPMRYKAPLTKRGGERFRKRKEKMKTTALMQQRNRVAFGIEEEQVIVAGGDEMVGQGMLGQSNVSTAEGMRIAAEDTQKLRKMGRVRKRLEKKGRRLGKLKNTKDGNNNNVVGTGGGGEGTVTSLGLRTGLRTVLGTGTTTTISFAPGQEAIELLNPANVPEFRQARQRQLELSSAGVESNIQDLDQYGGVESVAAPAAPGPGKTTLSSAAGPKHDYFGDSAAFLRVKRRKVLPKVPKFED
ncbi:MAG: hypothetical protein MHM6MM_005818 [Cercozoa sp. M6MM]